jgi:hypothetical protein
MACPHRANSSITNTQLTNLRNPRHSLSDCYHNVAARKKETDEEENKEARDRKEKKGDEKKKKRAQLRPNLSPPATHRFQTGLLDAIESILCPVDAASAYSLL